MSKKIVFITSPDSKNLVAVDKERYDYYTRKKLSKEKMLSQASTQSIIENQLKSKKKKCCGKK